MLVKKSSNRGIVFDNKQLSVDLEIEEGGFIKLGVRGEAKNFVIDKPGEYEFENLGVIALEVPKEGYDSRIDLVRISYNEADILVIFQELELNKSILDKVDGIDVLFTNLVSLEYLRKLLTNLSPSVLIVPTNVAEEEKVLLEKISKEFGETNIKTETKIAIKGTDADGEDKTTEIYFLN